MQRMHEATLWLVERYVDIGSISSVPVLVLTRIQMPDGASFDFSSQIANYGRLTTSPPQRYVLRLSTTMMGQLKRFVRYIYQQPGSQWDSFSFLEFIAGMFSGGYRYPAHKGNFKGANVAHPARLSHGGLYVLKQTVHLPTLALVGLAPEYALTVLQPRGHLVIARLDTLMAVYESTVLQRFV